jgi:hypothetical protein
MIPRISIGKSGKIKIEEVIVLANLPFYNRINRD